MKLKLIFDYPVNGWWDGGAKTSGVFEPDACHRSDADHTCFGSWELNHYFNVKTGRTDKETISRAVRYLKKHTKRPHRIEIA